MVNYETAYCNSVIEISNDQYFRDTLINSAVFPGLSTQNAEIVTNEQLRQQDCNLFHF